MSISTFGTGHWTLHVKLCVAAMLLALTVRMNVLHDSGRVQMGWPFTRCVGFSIKRSVGVGDGGIPGREDAGGWGGRGEGLQPEEDAGRAESEGSEKPRPDKGGGGNDSVEHDGIGDAHALDVFWRGWRRY